MADFTRIGFGQVEPNQLSAQKTGQIYASLKLDNTVQILQNGEFMYYDYAKNMVTAEPQNDMQEPMLVFNEIKIYEDLLSYKDFAMIRVGDNYVTNRAAVGRITSENADGTVYGDGALTIGENANPAHTEYGYRMDGIAPRLFKTNVGDVMTTNMVKVGEEYNVGDLLTPKAVTTTYKDAKGQDKTYKTLVLEAAAGTEKMLWQVAKVYTMPDGQPGLKVQRIQ